MKIELIESKRSTLEEFADKYKLVMIVNECGPSFTHDKYYAGFDNVEIVGDSILSSKFGEGASQEEAIKNYTKLISEKTIIINISSIHRKRITVPDLIENGDNNLIKNSLEEMCKMSRRLELRDKIRAKYVGHLEGNTGFSSDECYKFVMNLTLEILDTVKE